MRHECAPSEIQISTGARLHFGPLSYHPTGGRHFGGIGMMVAQPGWTVFASPKSSDSGDEVVDDFGSRSTELLNRFRQRAPEEWQPPAVRIEVRSAIPSHHGLGSGTQLAMAIGDGLTRLAGVHVTAAELAQQLGRGVRSAIGLWGYESGGFLVDAGQLIPGELGALACRLDVPEHWRVVLMYPASGIGLSGDSETQVLSNLQPMSDALTGRLSRLVLTELLPALQQSNCEQFSIALEEYGRHVGEFFQPVQGDVFAHSTMSALARKLALDGVHGIAQSSWGPLLANVVDSEAKAEQLKAHILSLSTDAIRCEITQPMNTGRRIQ